MSFSSDIKKELCKDFSADKEALKAELYGILLFGRHFSQREIVFKTESHHACHRAAVLLENLYMPIIEKQSTLRVKNSENRLYRLSVVDELGRKRILDDYGHLNTTVTRRVNRANLSSDELSSAFIRGVFLSCGSVTDPMKSYHCEFCVPHKNLSVDLCKILSEITECNLNPKTVQRNGAYVVYFKGSEEICDLLTYIGAPICAMEIMGTKAVKQVRNVINRRNNSEIANINKVASASAKQLEAIEKIKKTIGLEALPDDIKEIAILRLESPEMSLRELGQALVPPISRSGANHRIQKLMEIAEHC